jgi:hypothetical protein
MIASVPMIASFGSEWIACGIQQIAAQPMQLSLVAPFVGRLDDLCGLGEAIQSIGRLPVHTSQYAVALIFALPYFQNIFARCDSRGAP